VVLEKDGEDRVRNEEMLHRVKEERHNPPAGGGGERERLAVVVTF
jgi:hypothetical protein